MSSNVPQKKFRLRHDVSLEQTPSNKGYLFDSRTGYIFLLNPTGFYISKLIQESFLTVEQIVDWLTTNFAIPESSPAREGVEQFLDCLSNYNLLGED